MDRRRQQEQQGGRGGRPPGGYAGQAGDYHRHPAQGRGVYPARPAQQQQQHPRGPGTAAGGVPAGPSSIRQRPTGAGPGTAAGSGANDGRLTDRLVATAADASQPSASRVAALQQLHQALYSPATQVEALQHLPNLWPLLVALLWDPQHAVCAAAAAPVGALGALTAQAAAAQQAQRGIASGAGGMLFDWLLPVLTNQASPGGARLSRQQLTAILLALRNCLAGVDATTLARYANAVLEVCQARLEDEATPPQLVPPLLEVVMQVSKHQHSLRARFQDLVDLLLGWALEPALPAAARLLLGRTLLSFQPIWQQQRAFAASLLGSLLSDAERFAGTSSGSAPGPAPSTGTSAAAEGGGPSEKEQQEGDTAKLLGLTPCILAILEASWQAGDDVEEKRAAGVILRLAQCLAATAQHLAAHSPPPAPGPALVADLAPVMAELSSHVIKLAELASKLAQAGTKGAQAPAAVPAIAAAATAAVLAPRKILQRPAQQAQQQEGEQQPAGSSQGGPEEGEQGGQGQGLEPGLAAALEGLSVSQPAGSGPSQGPGGEQAQASSTPQQDGGARVGGGSSRSSSVGQRLQEAFSAALAFVQASLQIPSIAARPDAVTALVSVLRRWLGVGAVLERRGAYGELEQLWGAAEGALLCGAGSAIARLRLCSNAAVLQRCAELYLQLLHQSPSALPQLLEEMEGLAAALQPSARRAGTAAAQRAQQEASRDVAGGPGGSGRQQQGEQEGAQAAALLQFDLELLATLQLGAARRQQGSGESGGGEAAQQGGLGSGLEVAVPGAWALLYRLAGPSGPLLHRHPALWSQAFELLHSLTLPALLLSPQPSPAAAGPSLPPLAVALRMLRLLTALLSSPTGHGPAAGTRAGGLERPVDGAAGAAAAGQPPPLLGVLAALERFSGAAKVLMAQLLASPIGQGAWAGAVHEVQHAVHAVVALAADSPFATVRAAALRSINQVFAPERSSTCASGISSGGPGSMEDSAGAATAGTALQLALLADPSLVAGIVQAGVAGSADLAPAAAQQAQQLLQGAGASLVFAAASSPAAYSPAAGAAGAGLLAASCSSEGEGGVGGDTRSSPRDELFMAPATSEPPATLERAQGLAFALALQPQRRLFKPAQLTKLLNWLTQAAPATVLVGGSGHASSQLQDWLPRLVYSLPEMPAQASRGRSPYEGPILSPEELPTLSHLALFAVNEAARQCVASRLKTHLGGPTQTFAALDQALQRLAAEAGSGPGLGAAPGQRLQPAWLFLEFLHALEQATFNAHEGSVGRPPPAGSAAPAFFTGNKKVCQDWFARMCPLALRAAAAAQHHPLTLRLGLVRLRHLAAQARQLAASAPPAAPVAVVTFSAAPGGAAPGTLLKAQSTPQAAPGPSAPEASPSSGPGTGDAVAGRGSEAATKSASPAAALLAATQGAAATGAPPMTPRLGGHQGLARRGLLPASSAPRQAQQAQQLWAKVAEAAAVTARALSALRDPDGLAELQAYCASAFRPLWEVLGQADVGVAVAGGLTLGTALQRGTSSSSSDAGLQGAAPAQQPAGEQPQQQPAAEPEGIAGSGATASAGSGGSGGKAAASDTAPWGWLEGVRLHAAGQYEAALQQYAGPQLLSSGGSGTVAPTAVRELLAALRAEAYTAAQDWEGLQSWAQESSSLPPSLSSHYRTLASWATGDGSSAERQLAQQAEQAAPAGSGPSGAGLLQGALASSLAAESAVLRAVLQQSQQAAQQAGQGGRGSAAGAQAPQAQEAVAAVLQQAQLMQSVGGALYSPALLASPLAYLGQLNPALAAQEGPSPPVIAAPPTPFAAELLGFSPWEAASAAPWGRRLGGTGGYTEGPDAGPIAVLLAGSVAGTRLGNRLQPGPRAEFLLAAARTAGAGGNSRLAASLLEQAEAAVAAVPEGPWQRAAQLEAALGRLCLAAHVWTAEGASGAEQAQQQAAWKLLQDCRAALHGDSNEGPRVSGQASQAQAQLGPTVAATALLVLRWSAPAAGAAGESSIELLDQAKALVAESQLPWPVLEGSSGGGGGSSTSGAGEASAEAGGTMSVGAWEAELLEASATGEAQQQPGPLVAYAALKAALAAVPSCAQLWWRFAEWAAQHAEHGAAPPGGTGVPAQQQASSAAFMAYCQALSLGGGGGRDAALPGLLQILRLLPNAPALVPLSTLQAGFSAVPTSSWLAVVPQLVAQLARFCCLDSTAGTAGDAGDQGAVSGDQAPAVTEAVLGVLRRVGREAPAEVVLPALVELREPHAGTEGLQRPLQELVQGCTSHHPLLAEQLCILGDGLTSAAVLWEEQWHTLLQEAAGAAARGLGALQTELESLSGDQQAVALKEGYLSAMAPSILLIQSGVGACSTEGQASLASPHEQHMLSALGPMLRALCDHLALPPASAGELPQRVQAIKQAAARMAQHLQGRQLQLADVAPALATLRQAAIPVPGAPSGVTLESFLPTATILHTKTRPKRVAMLGSDGREYKYLLKGKEDLRTDERLCQFLRAAGAALQGGTRGVGGGPGLEVHSFGVTPVARRTGLVQWVGDTVPLYEVYTSWHARRAERAVLLASMQAQAAAAQGGARAAAAPPTSTAAKPPKPVEAFFSALIPALKVAGVDPACPRDQWPLPVLQRVFRGLAAAAPRSMLADELRCGAAGAAHWWQRQRAFSASVAAMSIVGHLLGLGDRHLDNILLHKRHGHVVHLDFNVVFGRGLALKVPEVVPFRLTQSLAAALGPAGACGRFRLCCKGALRALRAGAKPLAALLEASVADPLVDWNAEERERARRRAFDLAAALQLFALSYDGSAASVHSAAGAAAAALAASAEALGGYVQLFQQAATAAAAGEESRELLNRCQATLNESEGQEQTAAVKLGEGQAAMRVMLAQAKPVAELAARALQECQAWQERHLALVSVLLTEPPPTLAAPAAVWDPTSSTIPLSLAIQPSPGQGPPPLLQLALGMPPSEAPVSSELLLQATALDEAGHQLLAQRAEAVGSLMASLQQYTAALTFLLGPQYAGTSRHARWGEAFQAGLALPAPQGFQRAAELAPRSPDPSSLLPVWQSLRAGSASTSALLQRLEATRSELQMEKVDLALFANEGRERLLGLLGSATEHSMHSVHSSSTSSLLRAFAAFSQRQAEAVQSLAPGSQKASQPAPTLDSIQPLVLGYTTAAVAFQQAGPGLFEQLFTAPDGSSRLAWLSGVVQAVDGLASLALELQLLCPALLALAASQQAQQAAAGLAAVSAAAGAEAAAAQRGQQGQLAAAVQALEALAVQFPPLGNVLQLLQQVHATAVQLAEAAGTAGSGGQPEEAESSEAPGSPAAQQRWLVHTAHSFWEAAAAAAAPLGAPDHQIPAISTEERGHSGSGGDGAAAAAAGPAPRQQQQQQEQQLLVAWEACSAVVAGIVNREVASVVVPAVAASFQAAAAAFREAAAGLGAEQQTASGGGGLGGTAGTRSAARAAQRAQHAELVPFTDFDDSLAPGGELLGELEPAGAELEGGSPSGHSPTAAVPDLVPFAHWGDSLEGEGELLEPLEPLEGPAGHAGADGAQQAQRGPRLVPFAGFDETLDGVEGLLEPLEAAGELEGEGLSAREWEGPSQLSSEAGLYSQQSEHPQQQLSQGGGAGLAAEEQLAATLGSCAGAGGALAAVDSLHYLTGLAFQQCMQQAQQAAAELARFEWINEEGLLQAGVTPDQLGTWAAASAIGVQLVGDPGLVHPLLAGWSLRSSRLQLLRSMQSALGGLAALQPQLQQWQVALGQAGTQLEEELSAVMLFAVPALKGHLGSQQQWLATSSAHATSLVQLTQAVLQLEASRAAQSPQPLQQPPGSAAAQQAAAGSSWQQYEAVLQQMQQLYGAYMAADAATTGANRELAGLQQRRSEALLVMQSAQARAADAEVQLGTAALPLIKSTRQLGQRLKALAPSLAALPGHTTALQRAQRLASTLCSVLRRAQRAEQQGPQAAQQRSPTAEAAAPAHMLRQCQEVAQQLGSALGCLGRLPEAIQGVERGLQASQVVLAQKKGKGDAAARQTVGDLVAKLRPAVEKLAPQIEGLPPAAQQLAALPATLASLAQQAQRTAAQLSAEHNLAPLSGLPTLLGLPAPSEHPTAPEPGDGGAGAAAAAATEQPWQPSRPSLAQTVGLPPLLGAAPGQQAAGGAPAREWLAEGEAYAASVVGAFWAKLLGRPAAPAAARGRAAQDAAGSTLDAVEEGELVGRWIDEATSEANLARMYEGWMAWI